MFFSIALRAELLLVLTWKDIKTASLLRLQFIHVSYFLISLFGLCGSSSQASFDVHPCVKRYENGAARVRGSFSGEDLI